MSPQPTPYKISIPQSHLEKLHRKLADADYPDELETDDQWPYGAPLKDVQRLANYWADGFDWRKAEEKLNELPHYRMEIEVEGFGEVQTHFVWKRSGREGAVPVLFVHGWPGSFIEVTKLLPLLCPSPDEPDQENAPAFDIIAPSLPNFGFSQKILKPGFATTQYASLLNSLMLSLGYPTYTTQGGDWGFYITRAIALLYPQHCKASHINMIRAKAPTLWRNPVLAVQHAVMPYSERERKGMERSGWFMEEGNGYRVLQSTKPQTIGYAFADSPVALLAWVWEKLHDWTDGYAWTDEEVLTWISIYYFSTAGPNAHVRIYYEVTHNPTALIPSRDRLQEYIPSVKLGLAYFPRELTVVPRTWGKTLGPVVYESVSDRGGHFAAWERPDVISSDLKKMYMKGGPCYNIIEGRSGYA